MLGFRSGVCGGFIRNHTAGGFKRMVALKKSSKPCTWSNKINTFNPFFVLTQMLFEMHHNTKHGKL